jgi:iron(II)-dependent oxidoreductase
MLATCKLGGLPFPNVELAPSPGGEVIVDGGAYEVGTSDHPWAYDNERPKHTVHIDAFAIDAGPVTNAEWQSFIDDGGYNDPRWWSDEGWKWCQQEALTAPLFWDPSHPRAADAPVMHVCWHEADAFAAWAGRRLPTEREWEVAATAGLLSGTGQVWEWTSSTFEPWPGFTAFPYREYSEVFFGPDYKVLRGGSWASHTSVIRPTFRNWDYPIRRQIFSGLRTARDLEAGGTS